MTSPFSAPQLRLEEHGRYLKRILEEQRLAAGGAGAPREQPLSVNGAAGGAAADETAATFFDIADQTDVFGSVIGGGEGGGAAFF